MTPVPGITGFMIQAVRCGRHPEPFDSAQDKLREGSAFYQSIEEQ
jgi:hypothetical protein